MRRDLAVLSDRYTLLDLHERADFRIVTYLSFICVHKNENTDILDNAYLAQILPLGLFSDHLHVFVDVRRPARNLCTAQTSFGTSRKARSPGAGAAPLLYPAWRGW